RSTAMVRATAHPIVSIREPFGPKDAMSALPPKADIAERDWNVRFVPEADIRRTYPQLKTKCERFRASKLLFASFAQSFGGCYVVQSLVGLLWAQKTCGPARHRDTASSQKRLSHHRDKNWPERHIQADEQHLHLCHRQSRHCAPWLCLVHGCPTREAQYCRLQL